MISHDVGYFPAQPCTSFQLQKSVLHYYETFQSLNLQNNAVTDALCRKKCMQL